MNEPQAVVDARTEIRVAMALAEAIYLRRKELRLTQADLADRAGLTQAEISRIEGSDAVPALSLLTKLARALDAVLNIAIDGDNSQISLTPRGYAAQHAFLSVGMSSTLNWLSELDPDDQVEALAEIRDAIERAEMSGESDLVREAVRAWEITVAVMRDPGHRAALTGVSDESDYIEVAAPG